MEDIDNKKEVKLFIRPNCVKSAAFIKNLQIPQNITVIDVTTESGALLANEHGILKLPAALIFDDEASFIDRAYTCEGLISKLTSQDNR